ncbi:MAG: restriction endonuclease subunit S [Microcystis aeruginosa G11-01]|nr:restriction endonuclease subunit S [Microcystis aeruginosa G11-01]
MRVKNPTARDWYISESVANNWSKQLFVSKYLPLLPSEEELRVELLRERALIGGGEWEVKRLEELLLFKNGINATKEQYGKGIKFINVMDIINNDFIFHDNIIGCVEITEKAFEDSKVGYGDVLFQRSSETREEVGQASVYLDKDKSATFGGFVTRGKKIGEYNPIFMNFLLKTDLIRKDITDKSGGSTRYNVGQETLKSVTIDLPSISEQNKIAEFLIAIDEKIAQLTHKCELLAQYKKGVMQKIFSQEVRFKDEDGRNFPDWKNIKLDKVISERSEISDDAEVPTYSLTIQDGVTPKTDRYEREHLVTDTSNAYKLVKKNDFAYNPMNLRFGAIARYYGEQPVKVSKYYQQFQIQTVTQNTNI